MNTFCGLCEMHHILVCFDGFAEGSTVGCEVGEFEGFLAPELTTTFAVGGGVG